MEDTAARSAAGAEAASASAASGGGAGLQRCDFCGAASPTVRRVALDRGYDRLLHPHRELFYACPPCSEAKERQRRAPAGG